MIGLVAAMTLGSKPMIPRCSTQAGKRRAPRSDDVQAARARIDGRL
jgi:hypothetical protein